MKSFLLVVVSSFFWLCPSQFFAEDLSNEIASILENRISDENMRHPTFSYVLELMKRRGVKTIVETGTTRGGESAFEVEGGSTILFADWASRNGAMVYSVDLSREAVKSARKALLPYHKHVTVTQGDSIQYLQNFGSPIDFLYLDSFDVDIFNPLPSQQHHLKEIQAAFPKLTKNSIVMIDDCALPHGGKGRLAIQYLRSKGWKIVCQAYQVIMVYQGEKK